METGSENEGLFKKICAVLMKFKVEDLQKYALNEFPDISWYRVCELIKRTRKEIQSKSVAMAIIEIAMCQEIERIELQKILDILKLKELSLSAMKNWYSYELSEKSLELANMFPNEIATHIQNSVKSLVLVTRAPFDYDSVLVGIKRNHKLIAFCVSGNFIFFCQRPSNQILLNAIVSGLGYAYVKDCHLSGGHIPSLLQILYRKHGAVNFQEVISKSVYKQMPRHTPTGLDFTNVSNIQDHFKKCHGDENETLQLRQLTLHTKVQCDADTIYSRADMSSADVESSLRKMAEANIIPMNSFFFSMLKEHSKNEMKINISTPFM